MARGYTGRSDFFLSYSANGDILPGEGKPGARGHVQVERLPNAVCTPDTVRPGQRGERRKGIHPRSATPPLAVGFTSE